MKLFLNINFTVLLLSILLFSCDTASTPKPKAYFRIDFPEKEYQLYRSEKCAFNFEYPTYSRISKYSGLKHDCWFNLDFVRNGARLHCSYIPIENNLEKLLRDSYTLAMKHTSKAVNIGEEIVLNPTDKVYGLIYSIEGNAASPIQFHLTDSVHHFLRASLYFNVAPNSDSVAPVVDFIREDINHLVKTFKWE